MSTYDEQPTRTHYPPNLRQLQQVPGYNPDLHYRSREEKDSCADCGAAWPCSGALAQIESIRECGVVNRFWYLPMDEMLHRYEHGRSRVRVRQPA